MLGTKSGVGKLLQDKFPDIILWHRLGLAVGHALEIISGTNDFQSFFEHLYSLYSQLPKNKWELINMANKKEVKNKDVLMICT